MPGTEAIFPLVDPVGPWRDDDPDARTAFVDLIAREVAPFAAQADAHGVTRATIDRLAAAGLLGGQQAPAVQRDLAETLAGADATTWFCWVQHQTPTRILEGAVAGLRQPASEELVQGLLPSLRSGEQLAAVAFAHVRRPGAPNPVATRVDGGWRLDGTLDWVTSWDIADVVMVMAHAPAEDALVCCYLPAGRGPESTIGVAVGEVLPLLAMGGTHTRPVALDAVVVPDAAVGAVLDRRSYLESDALRTCDANPAAFGVVRGAVAELTVVAELRNDETAADLAAALAGECRALRARAYACADEDGVPTERRELRARSLDLALRATTAVVVARAGAAMLTPSAAERRAREALFLQVQAQTAPTRDAQLALAARNLDLLH